MENDKIEEYGMRYKRVQKRLTIALMVFILIISLLLIASGVIIIVFNPNAIIISVGTIMILLGIFDAFISIKFKKRTIKKIEGLSNKKAAERYSRITGKK